MRAMLLDRPGAPLRAAEVDSDVQVGPADAAGVHAQPNLASKQQRGS